MLTSEVAEIFILTKAGNLNRRTSGFGF